MGARIGNNERKESFSNDLLQDIYQGNYVLIIGDGIVLNSEIGSLRDYLNKECHRTCEEEGWIVTGSLKPYIKKMLKDKYNYDIPKEANPDLIKLIKTKCFPLVMTTTFDGYVEEIMRETYSDELKIKSICAQDDINQDINIHIDPDNKGWINLPPTLYYVYGKAEGNQNFAYNDDDYISLLSRWITAKPTQLIQYLANKKILAIGCQYENWQFRFFWYCLRQNFTNMKGDVAIELEKGSKTDDSLRSYLTAKEIENHGKSRVFLKELCDKIDSLGEEFYQSMHKAKSTAGGVFISYASEDYPYVCQIYNILAQNRIPVWFDNQELYPGTDYDGDIRKAIGNCKIFMPILSSQTSKDLEAFDEKNELDKTDFLQNIDDKDKRYYFKEWDISKNNQICRTIPVILNGFNINGVDGKRLVRCSSIFRTQENNPIKGHKWAEEKPSRLIEAIRKII